MQDIIDVLFTLAITIGPVYYAMHRYNEKK